MRKEASLEQWKALYDIGLKIKEIQPWKDLWDMDLFMISLPEQEEPFFCSVIGRNEECFGILIYEGLAGLKDFVSLIECPKDENLANYVINEFTYLTYNLDSREYVPREQLKTIKDLGLKFRGVNQWVYFESYKKGYHPYILDQKEVLLVTECLDHFLMAFQAYKEENIEVDFESRNVLSHFYDKQKDEWVNTSIPFPILEFEYETITLSDELLKKRLNKKPSTSVQLEIDMPYLNINITDKEYDRPVNPKLILLADHKEQFIYGQEMIIPGMDEFDILYDKIISYILEYGRPNQILVRNKAIYFLLKELCESLNIKIFDKRSLPAIDCCIEEFEEMR